MTPLPAQRPQTTVVLAMSADGKIADAHHSAARFGSAIDKAHLEERLAEADATLFGAGTLRAYGSTLRILSPSWLQWRHEQKKAAQPTHIVCSASAQLDPQLPFFRQPLPRWLLTSPTGAATWQNRPEFERVLIFSTFDGTPDGIIDWQTTLKQLSEWGIERLLVMGGGTLVAALLEANLIDELWLTICPLLLGGSQAPTPVEGTGFLEAVAPRLELLSVKTEGQEVFLHYRLPRTSNFI
ncbi:MAG: RibD family protein [Synechococcales cyanobacterium M58_A2018_015]|nr:RibD family protein [Synechococcales cyanobacterium M58_A2018_015]